MKAEISVIYTGDRFTADPEKPDGRLLVGKREIPFKRGGKSIVVPAETAVELCARNGGKDWKCEDTADQKEVEAAIAKAAKDEADAIAKQKAEAEAQAEERRRLKAEREVNQ